MFYLFITVGCEARKMEKINSYLGLVILLKKFERSIKQRENSTSKHIGIYLSLWEMC